MTTNRKYRTALLRAAAGAMLFVAGGCAMAPQAPDVVWPDPPDPPRIKFLGSLQSRDDVGGRSVREILAGNEQSQALYQPMGLVTSTDGRRLYVVDRVWNVVFVFDFDSGAMRKIGDGERYPLSLPVGVALDSAENVYVTDSGSHSVRVYDRHGAFLRAVGKDELIRPTGIAIDTSRGLLYVVDTGRNEDTDEAHRVRVFDLEGSFLRDIGRRGDGDGEFNFPTFANLDAEGRLYVVDSVNNRVEVFDADGTFLSKFGRAGDHIGDFARPKGVAVDGFGNIFVVDSRWSNVQIFNRKGQLLMIFAGVGTEPGMLLNPTAITIDRQNKIYIADSFGKRVNTYQLLDGSAPPDSNEAADVVARTTNAAAAADTKQHE